MKACFIMQRRFAYLGHEMARQLIETHGLDEVCAFVYTRDSYDFLKSQKDIPYTAFALDEDIVEGYKKEKLNIPFLTELENEYGIPTLWQYINADRVLRSGQLVREYPYDTCPYTYEELLRIVQVYAKTIIAFLDEEKPDFIFAPQVGSVGTLLLTRIARKRGIKTFFIMNVGIESITCVSETDNSLTGAEEIKKRDESLPTESLATYVQARDFIESFREKPRTYSALNEHPRFRSIGRKAQLSFLSPTHFARSFKWFFAMLVDYFAHPQKRRDYTYISPYWYVWDRVKRKTRNAIGYSDLYDRVDLHDSFAFFPLSLEPELALLVHAPFTNNQLEMVRLVAQSLPVGMMLFVKEHPHMVGYRTRSFYRALKNIPNVRLMEPEIRATKIIPHAKLVFTTTGTAGFEALILGTPIITLGDVFYNVLPQVARMGALESLPALVKQQLARPRIPEDTLLRFVAAIFEDGVAVDVPYLWALEPDKDTLRHKIQPYVALIAKKVGLA